LALWLLVFYLNLDFLLSKLAVSIVWRGSGKSFGFGFGPGATACHPRLWMVGL